MREINSPLNREIQKCITGIALHERKPLIPAQNHAQNHLHKSLLVVNTGAADVSSFITPSPKVVGAMYTEGMMTAG